ncbi:Gamma-aminobutyric acid receptor subunit beta, partial [Orchesella cincta]
MAEQKKKEMQDHHDEHHAKQTVSSKQTEVRFKVHDPKSYAKGAGTLENTVNGARGGDEENPAHPILPPGKDINSYTELHRQILI